MFPFALLWKRLKTLFRPSFEEASKGTLEISFKFLWIMFSLKKIKCTWIGVKFNMEMELLENLFDLKKLFNFMDVNENIV